MENKTKDETNQKQPAEKQESNQKQPPKNQVSQAPNNPTQSQQSSAGSQPKSNNTLLLIIGVILVGLIILAVVGYFGWKYVNSYISKKTSGIVSNTGTSNQTTTTAPTTQSTSPSDTSATKNSTTPKTTVTSPKGGEMPINGYVIPDSGSRVISESEITSLTPWQLKVARNEIYARHGRPFVHKDLQCYFATQNWYGINSNYSETLLSYTENKNVATILNYEEKIGSSYLRVDSGC